MNGIINWFKHLQTEVTMFPTNSMHLFVKIFTDCTQNQNSEYDPARLIGYGFVLLGGLQFLISEAWITYHTKTFDTSNFSMGLAAISGAICAAAVGVRVKNIAEIPFGNQGGGDPSSMTSAESVSAPVQATAITPLVSPGEQKHSPLATIIMTVLVIGLILLSLHLFGVRL